MPINWTTSPKPPFPPDKEMAKLIIEQGVAQTQKNAQEILSDIRKFHKFNYPKR